jgi:hypothetical protein
MTIEQIKHIFEEKNYKFFSLDKPYNLNIIGIRSTNNIPNAFDDLLVIVYKDSNKKERLLSFQATTDPGLFWLQNPLNVKGTLILVPGQYESCYQLGVHGRSSDHPYRALEQVAPMTYVRDFDRDKVLDFELINDPKKIISGIYKTNIHRANELHESVQIDKWSAGCQVVADPVDFATLINLCDKASQLYGNKFTYTLLDNKDFLTV